MMKPTLPPTFNRAHSCSRVQKSGDLHQVHGVVFWNGEVNEGLADGKTMHAGGTQYTMDIPSAHNAAVTASAMQLGAAASALQGWLAAYQ